MTARRRRLAAEWASYRESVLPVNAGPVQVLETQRAFYAGAAAFASVVMRDASHNADFTEEDDQLADDLMSELQAYSAEATAFAAKAGR